jgi:hypothetical protein
MTSPDSSAVPLPDGRSRAGGGYRVLPQASRSVWEKAFVADPHSQAFHSPDWVDGVCRVGGFRDVTRVYETPDGRLLVLPMVRRSWLGGALAHQASMPANWGIGGVISADPVRPEDLTAICADLRRQRGVLRTFIRPGSRTADVWAAADLPGVKSKPGLGHVLDLEGGFDVVWRSRFTGTARTAVRKAEKSGVVVERDSTGARLPEYFTLVEHSVDRWARQQNEPLLLSRWRARHRQTVEKMQAMAAAVPAFFNLYLALWEGRPVAGIVVYRGNGTRYTAGAMIKELASPVRANYLLHRTAIEDACAAGSTHFDFGESGGSSGLAVYKTRFGARPEPYSSFVIERLPLTEADHAARSAVKRLIGFREATLDPAGPPTPGR